MIRKQPNMNVGAALLFVVFCLLFFILIFRYMSIQITGEAAGQPLAAKAQKMYYKKNILEAKRGTIYDRNGEVIAQESSSYDLIAILDKDYPNHVKDISKTAAKLAEYLKMSPEDISEILSKNKFQVEFGESGNNLSFTQKNEIKSLNLPGIIFRESSKRFYPNGVFASHLVGFVEKNRDNKLVGTLGIEKQFDSILKGKDGNIQSNSDLWGVILPNSKKQIVPQINGSDIYLTIDKNIQFFLEEAMEKVDGLYKPKKIFAVISNPKTGEILAASQRPSFNPNTRDGLQNSWQNEIVESIFEPGSTLKVFSLAASIEAGVFDPNKTYKSGKFKVNNDSVINDHNKGRGWGEISYLEGVQRSSNVAFAHLLKRMGFETFYEYLINFGFGKPTGIGIGNESKGKILYEYDIEKYTTIFGQGTTVTPLQMVQAASAIANPEGNMMKPYIISKMVDSKKNEEKVTNPVKVASPISSKTAKEVRDILETVITSPVGTGKLFKSNDFLIAGKTGTAQISNPNGKGYLEGWDNYLFSFIGMAPKDNPELVMYVSVQQPDLDENNHESGAVPVSMIFNPVMNKSLKYLNINEEKSIEKRDNIITVQNYIGDSVNKTVESLKSNGLEPIVIGEGDKIVSQFPLKEEKLIKGEKVFLKTKGATKIPNLIGWSKRNVYQFAQIAGFEISSSGAGSYVLEYNLLGSNKLNVKF